MSKTQNLKFELAEFFRLCLDQTCAFCRIESRKFDSIRLICRIGFFRLDRPHSRIFDIRNTLLRVSNIRHSTEANIGSKIESNLFAHLQWLQCQPLQVILIDNDTYKMNMHEMDFELNYVKKFFEILVTYKQFPSFLRYCYIFF